MIRSSTGQLRFCIFPTACPEPEILELHNRTFNLWREVWSSTLEKLRLETAGLAEEFVRQDYVACIADGNAPVAIHLYSFFSIDSEAARAHRYMSGNYPEIYFAKLAQQSVRNVMSMEYMTVHPEWRKSAGAPHIGGALGGLAIRAMQHFGADAAIAPCRRDHKVNEMAFAYGGEPILANVLNHNVPCDLVMIHRDRVKAHTSPEVQALLESLWDKREYFPPYALNRNSTVIPLKRKVA